MMYSFGDKEWPGLAKVVEEISEFNTEVGRLMQTRGDPAHWKGDLVKRIANELADVAAVVEVMVEIDDRIDPVAHEKRKLAKKKRYLKWHRGAALAASPAHHKKVAMKTKPKKITKSKGSKKDDGKKAAAQHKSPGN